MNCNEMSVGERMVVLAFALQERLLQYPVEGGYRNEGIKNLYVNTVYKELDAPWYQWVFSFNPEYPDTEDAESDLATILDMGDNPIVVAPPALLSVLFVLSTTDTQPRGQDTIFDGFWPTAKPFHFARGFGLDLGTHRSHPLVDEIRTPRPDRSFPFAHALANGMGEVGDLVLTSPPQGFPEIYRTIPNYPKFTGAWGQIVDRDNQGVTVRWGFGMGGQFWEERYNIGVDNPVFKNALLIPMQYDLGPYLYDLPTGPVPPAVAKLVESCKNPDKTTSEKQGSTSDFSWGKLFVGALAVAGGAWGISKVIK